MSDSGIIGGIVDAAKDTGKGFVKGTINEVNQSIGQGVAQITGIEPSSQENQQKILQYRQKEATETPLKIADIENQIRRETMQREEKHRPAPITQQSKPAMVDLGKLMDKKRENKENKIAAA